MRAWLESEWQRRGGGALLLFPFAVLFAAVSGVRRALYRRGVLARWKAPVPVIVVGNITAGGTGKTPLVLHLVELLQRHGFQPGVVARGYGRVPAGEQDPLGVVRVFPDVATPEHFGDEPVLIARRSHVPVYISPDRPAAARALLDARHGVDVIVSDDGLQHYALARDLEIAVVDGERRFGNALPMPAGPLREPLARLDAVDAIVVNGGDTAAVPGAAPKYAMQLGRETWVSVATGETRDARTMALATRGRRAIAVAGIGHPARFFDHLARLGIEAEGRAFPDHYLFQPRDLRLREAEVILMTEKDAVKCRAFADARMWFLRVEAILPATFDELVLARLASLRRSADGPEAA